MTASPPACPLHLISCARPANPAQAFADTGCRAWRPSFGLSLTRDPVNGSASSDASASIDQSVRPGSAVQGAETPSSDNRPANGYVMPGPGPRWRAAWSSIVPGLATIHDGGTSEGVEAWQKLARSMLAISVLRIQQTRSSPAEAKRPAGMGGVHAYD